MTPHSSQRGMSLLETIIGLGLAIVVVSGAALALKRYVQSAKHLEILGQIEDLKIMIREKIDCTKTVSTQKATCDAGGHVALYSRSCDVVSGKTGAGSKVAPQYEVRAYCAKDAQGYYLDIEFRRLASVSGSTPDVDPLTGKSYEWSDLYKAPRRCQPNRTFLVRNGYSLPNYFNATLNGSTTFMDGHSLRNDDAALGRACQHLGYQGFVGPKPPSKTYSSASNNWIWTLPTPNAAAYAIKKASDVGNAGHLGNYNLMCGSPPAASDICD